MLQEQWYYIEREKMKGPISEDEIRRMLEEGILKRDSYLWSESMTDWKKASEISCFLGSQSLKNVYAPIPSNGFKESVANNEKKEVHPWMRYWARQLDLMLISVFFYLFIPSFLRGSIGILSFSYVAFWILIESLLLTNFGTTPGKWFFKIEISDRLGGRLNFAQALKRSFLVWFRGMGCGLPIVQLIMMFISYRNLKKYGDTSWDLDGGCLVKHQEINKVRILFILLFFIFLFLAFILCIQILHPSNAHPVFKSEDVVV